MTHVISVIQWTLIHFRGINSHFKCFQYDGGLQSYIYYKDIFTIVVIFNLLLIKLLTLYYFISGSHVKLNNTYLWDNVHIGDNCVLNRSLVASCVNIMNNAVVKNAVLAENVSVRSVNIE